MSREFSAGEGFEEVEEVLVAGEGVHIVLWLTETMQAAKLQNNEIRGCIDQKQKAMSDSNGKT